MKRLATHAAIAPALTVLLAGVACDPPKDTHTPTTSGTPVVTGTVNGKSAHRLISPGPGCRSAVVKLPACTSWWQLEIRDKAGRRHLVRVTKSVYNACRLNARYPACAKGA